MSVNTFGQSPASPANSGVQLPVSSPSRIGSQLPVARGTAHGVSSVAPIIIIGMHRSGTTMITDMLQKLGLYLGWTLQENSEALFFVERNEKLMNLCGGSWEMPGGVESLIRHEGMREAVTNQLLRDMRSPRFLSYLGPRRYLSYRKVDNIDFAWGWKDPRNTYLLPLWLDIFPDARIIHIHRNGIDVACSLETREHRAITSRVDINSRHSGFVGQLKRRWAQFKKESPLLYAYRRIGAFRSRLAPLSAYNRYEVAATSDLSTGFQLWCDYIGKCLELTADPSRESLTLKYEDFLADPETNLRNLVNFCRLSAPPEAIKAQSAKIRSDRRFAFKSNPEAVRLYERVRQNELMQRLGYSDL